MNEHSLQEMDELLDQIARLEAENLDSQGKLRGQDQTLALLLLLLAVDRGIYAVRTDSDWELLSPEEFKQKQGEKLPQSNPSRRSDSPRKRAA